MFCVHCGKELNDKAVFCPYCGVPTENFNAPKQSFSYKNGCSPTTIQTVAKIFMIIACVISAIPFLIPLAWCVPMTVRYCKSIENGEKVSVGFKVCTLIFVSLISGILMLCEE